MWPMLHLTSSADTEEPGQIILTWLDLTAHRCSDVAKVSQLIQAYIVFQTTESILQLFQAA